MFEFLGRHLWRVATDHAKDPLLAPYWTWDAIKLSKWNASTKKWERFIHEPSTADGLWKIQVRHLCCAHHTENLAHSESVDPPA